MGEPDDPVTAIRRSLAWAIHPDTTEICFALKELRTESARAASHARRNPKPGDPYLPKRLREARERLTDALEGHCDRRHGSRWSR